MIDITKGTIQIGKQEHDIAKYEVWWRTPAGLTSSLELAMNLCEKRDFDPQLSIVAVPVAIAVDESVYEELSR